MEKWSWKTRWLLKIHHWLLDLEVPVYNLRLFFKKMSTLTLLGNYISFQFFLASLCLAVSPYFICIYYYVNTFILYWLSLWTILCVKSVKIQVFSIHDYLLKRSLRIYNYVKIKLFWISTQSNQKSERKNILNAKNVKKCYSFLEP